MNTTTTPRPDGLQATIVNCLLEDCEIVECNDPYSTIADHIIKRIQPFLATPQAAAAGEGPDLMAQEILELLHGPIDAEHGDHVTNLQELTEYLEQNLSATHSALLKRVEALEVALRAATNSASVRADEAEGLSHQVAALQHANSGLCAVLRSAGAPEFQNAVDAQNWCNENAAIRASASTQANDLNNDRELKWIRLAIQAQIDGNNAAADNSPQCADWSKGVAAGFQGALDIINADRAAIIRKHSLAGQSGKGDLPYLVKYLKANFESNRQAAINSPDSADWSNGVAAGFAAVIEYIDAARAPAPTDKGEV
jgi:hypothetical protein